MDRFEYLFTLIGLVLGLSLVEVLGGLARTLKARRAIKLGWLTPLLGIVMIMETTTYWGVAWVIRDMLPHIWATLGGGVLITGGYYLAASLVFPDRPEDHPDLDAYYWNHKRQVLGIALACTLASQAAVLALGRVWTADVAVINLTMFALMAITCFSSQRWVNLAGLGAMIAILSLAFILP